MKTTTFNLRIPHHSHPTVHLLAEAHGQRCHPVPGCGEFADTFAFAAPLQILGTDTVALAGVAFTARLDQLSPAHHQAVTGLSLPATALLPESADDAPGFLRLAQATSLWFADGIRAALAELEINVLDRDAVTIPIVWEPGKTHIIVNHGCHLPLLSLTFRQGGEELAENKTARLGIDWGERTLLAIAESELIEDVQYHRLPPAALRLTRELPPYGHDTEWGVLRVLTHRILAPAIAHIVRRGQRVNSEHLRFKRMSAEVKRRMQRLGMIDFQRAQLPQLIHAAGGHSDRVQPRDTSNTCHRCHRPGVRDGPVFTCTGCGAFDADGNAAVVIRGARAR